MVYALHSRRSCVVRARCYPCTSPYVCSGASIWHVVVLVVLVVLVLVHSCSAHYGDVVAGGVQTEAENSVATRLCTQHEPGTDRWLQRGVRWRLIDWGWRPCVPAPYASVRQAAHSTPVHTNHGWLTAATAHHARCRWGRDETRRGGYWRGALQLPPYADWQRRWRECWAESCDRAAGFGD